MIWEQCCCSFCHVLFGCMKNAPFDAFPTCCRCYDSLCDLVNWIPKVCSNSLTKDVPTLSHTIRVWYIHLHLVDLYGKFRQIYDTWMVCWYGSGKKNFHHFSGWTDKDFSLTSERRSPYFVSCSWIFLGHLYRNNQLYGSSRSILPGPFLRIQIQMVPFQRDEIPALHSEKKFLKRYSSPSRVGEWWVDVSHGIQGFSIP